MLPAPVKAEVSVHTGGLPVLTARAGASRGRRTDQRGPGPALESEVATSMREGGEAVMTPGKEHPPLEILERPLESDTATGQILTASTGVILGKHGPSLGRTPEHDDKPEPVILTDSRYPQRERTLD